MGRKIERCLSQRLLHVRVSIGICLYVFINRGVCVSLMCELRSTELVFNSFNKYLFPGKST